MCIVVSTTVLPVHMHLAYGLPFVGRAHWPVHPERLKDILGVQLVGKESVTLVVAESVCIMYKGYVKHFLVNLVDCLDESGGCWFMGWLQLLRSNQPMGIVPSKALSPSKAKVTDRM